MQRPMRRGPARLGATQAPMRGSLAPQCRSCARAWVDTVLQRSAATTSRGRRAACCRANGAVRGGSTPRGYAADNATRRAASRPALPPRCRTPARSPAARTNPYAAAYRAAWPPARQGVLRGRARSSARHAGRRPGRAVGCLAQRPQAAGVSVRRTAGRESVQSGRAARRPVILQQNAGPAGNPRGPGAPAAELSGVEGPRSAAGTQGTTHPTPARLRLDAETVGRRAQRSRGAAQRGRDAGDPAATTAELSPCASPLSWPPSWLPSWRPTWQPTWQPTWPPSSPYRRLPPRYRAAARDGSRYASRRRT